MTHVADETERTITDDTDSSEDTAPTGQHRDVDASAESFLAIESQIAGDSARGIAVDAERIPATAVPEDYPGEFSSDDVLALDVELLEGDVVTVYVEWDLEGELGALLESHDLPVERFGDLHGREVSIQREGEVFVLAVSEEGDSRAIYGLWTMFALTLLGWLVVAVGLAGALAPILVVAWLAVGIFGLPVTTYLDAWHLWSTTDWDQGPLFWTALAAIPGVNVLSTLLYLYTRRRASSLE